LCARLRLTILRVHLTAGSIPNGTTKTEKYDSNSFGTSSFVEEGESEADMNKGPRKDEPGVEQEFSKRGQQFSKGSGQWIASDGYFSGEYPDGKWETSSYSTYEESGKIKWNDFSKSTEKAYDNRNPLVAITISADDIDSDEGHGKYENKSHSNSTFVKLNYADPGDLDA
jgi:hypothetical protein